MSNACLNHPFNAQFGVAGGTSCEIQGALKYHTLILFLWGAFFHVALHFKFVIFGNLLDVLLPFASPPGRHVLAIAASMIVP